eukprot:4255127-Amphidinium_carterae.1
MFLVAVLVHMVWAIHSSTLFGLIWHLQDYAASAGQLVGAVGGTPLTQAFREALAAITGQQSRPTTQLRSQPEVIR